MLFKMKFLSFSPILVFLAVGLCNPFGVWAEIGLGQTQTGWTTTDNPPITESPTEPPCPELWWCEVCHIECHPPPSTMWPSTTTNVTEITPTTARTTTSEPCPASLPVFTKTIYQGSLPAWPTAGTTVRLGIDASTWEGSYLRYELLTFFDFFTLTTDRDIIFTSAVSDGAFVGPNNVMLFEVAAIVVGDEGRESRAAVALVFPRSTAVEEELLLA